MEQIIGLQIPKAIIFLVHPFLLKVVTPRVDLAGGGASHHPLSFPFVTFEAVSFVELVKSKKPDFPSW